MQETRWSSGVVVYRSLLLMAIKTLVIDISSGMNVVCVSVSFIRAKTVIMINSIFDSY